MAFNSWEFILFFSIILAAYYLIPKYQVQNWLLLIGSYYFYASWNWKLLFLIITITIVNYYFGMLIHIKENKRNILLIVSIAFNLSVLCFFKYYNFFLQNLDNLSNLFGYSVEKLHMDIVLPVGISFYTFQVMSYTIDIFRGKIKPTYNIINFSLFVAFFPQLVAGPIERAARLLPQINSKRKLELSKIKSAIWLIFWGLYKKVVIADNISFIVDEAFSNSGNSTLMICYLSALAFAIQIYCDFSAYSDIARGCARLLGIELMRNFNLPYLAKNPSDFWKRWHISLSTWLKDYLYIPLGGNKKGKVRTYYNLLITMVLGGLWHGAAWNFVWWGIYHGVLLVGHRLLAEKRIAKKRTKIGCYIETLIMFQFTLFGWLLFRSTRKIIVKDQVVDDSLNQITEILTSFKNGLGLDLISLQMFENIMIYSIPLIIIQFMQKIYNNDYIVLDMNNKIVKNVLISFMLFSWLIYGVQSGQSFIYFQF